LITWQAAHVRVETRSELTRGVTIADLLSSDRPPEKNCEIATAVDVDGFIALFLNRMATLSARTPQRRR
jgi:purine nucleosidase